MALRTSSRAVTNKFGLKRTASHLDLANKSASKLPKYRTAFEPDSSATPFPRSMRTLGSEIVLFTVGEDKKQAVFTIHKDILAKSAPVFHRMFSTGFSEALSGRATLPEDSPEAFALFVQWLYSGSLKSLDPKGAPAVGWQDRVLECMEFADKYCLLELVDRLMTIWVQYHSSSSFVSDVFLLSDSTIKSNPPVHLWIVRMISAAILCRSTDYQFPSMNLIESLRGGIKAQVFKDVILRKRCHTKKPWDSTILCDYHIHPKNGTCPYSAMDKFQYPLRYSHEEQRVIARSDFLKY